MTTQDKLQWTGATLMIGSLIITSLFPQWHPWNIVLSAFGGAAFLTWGLMVQNRPQIVVNIAGLAICAGGLYKVAIMA